MVDGLSVLSPVLMLNSNEVVVVKCRPVSSKGFWWTSEEENNKAIGTDSSPDPSQPPLVDNAQISVTYSSVGSNPSNWRNSDSEFINFWVKEVLRKQLVEEQQTVEKSKTDHALIEEALRYGNVFYS